MCQHHVDRHGALAFIVTSAPGVPAIALEALRWTVLTHEQWRETGLRGSAAAKNHDVTDSLSRASTATGAVVAHRQPRCWHFRRVAAR